MTSPTRLTRRARLAVFAATAVLLAGCSSDTTSADVAAQNKSNIQRLANFYAGLQNGYATSKGGGNGPKDEADFKEYIKSYPADKLKMMGVDAGKIDELFTSERDGKPFKIRYKVGGGRGSVAPVIFEQDGKDGKKQVCFTGGKVEEVDQATYDQYFAGKSGSSAPGAPAGAPAAGGRPGGGRPAGAPTGPPGQ